MNTSIDRRQFLHLAGAGAIATALPLRALGQANAPLNFGYQNTSWGIVGMVAEDAKTFQQAGADVKFYHFDGGKSTRDAMIAGRVDVGVIGGTPFIIGVAKGGIVAISVAMYAGKTNAIVAAKGSGIKTVADLKGKRVGSQLGSATDYVFQNVILPKYGLAKSDITVVNIPHQNQVAAMVSKSIDAFAGVEPFPSVAEIEGFGTVLVDYANFDMQPVFLAVNKPVLDDKRDAVVALMRGWLAAVRIVNNQPDRAIRIVSARFKAQGYDIKDIVFKKMLEKIDVRPDYVPNMKEYLTQQSRILLSEKQIKTLPDWSKALDTSVLAQASKA